MITIQNPEFLILLPLALLPVKDYVKSESYGKKISISRFLIIVVLIMAASSPSVTQVKTASTEQKLNILVDNTTSTEVLKHPDLPEKVSKTVFTSGNNSRIFSQAAGSIEQGSYNLMVTDAQTDESVDEIRRRAEQKNATISVYDSEAKKEKSVWIEGPSTTVPEAKNKYTVRISSSVDKPVHTNITLDEEVLFSRTINGSYSFDKTFDTEGEHTLEALISSEDVFNDNNEYFKTIKVGNKPKILFVGKNGALENEFREFYEVESRDSLPKNLDEYYSVIMKKPLDNQMLRNYIAEGNGLVYTGGFDNYVPKYLPVIRTKEKEEEAGARIIILIDSSLASGGECVKGSESFCLQESISGGSAKESVKIAYSLVDSLDKNNEIGVVAYNTNPFPVSEPKSLAFNREDIKSKIARITPEGNSFHDRGLEGAATLTEKTETIVMLSDGKISTFAERRSVSSKSKDIARNLNPSLITVGMSDKPNQPFLEDLAELADGYYLENNEAGRLKFRFGAGGGESEYTPIKVVNPNHFITEELLLQSTTTGFKPVETKPSAQKLVTGSNGKNFLSAWRYGLGRVTSFSAGQENLERTINADPELVSRTVSWTVGDPKRKQDKWLELKDVSRPKNPEIRASYQKKGLTKRSEDLYSKELPKPELGLHEWDGGVYAYNYNSEIAEVGVNKEKLHKIAQKAGGEVYDSGNIDKLSENVKDLEKKVETRLSLSPLLLLVAMLLFLAEVAFRKMNGRL
ncbi:MAG: vWA domain-containing protein [Candidatus Nanohaloarchaea archaeon]